MAKRALLIGANYTATPAVQLMGCINDVVNVRNMLIDAYGYQPANIYVLRDDDNTRLPTKANILAGLANIIAMSSAVDTVWVHYSGHGSQIRDLNSDETDGLDECIVPSNYNVAGYVTDDDLFAILKNAKCRMILCFDSCNSGTVCDLQYSVNYNSGALTAAVNNARLVANTNIIMLSGCRDIQTSADAYNTMAKQNCGAFTIALMETLRTNGHNVSLLKLYSEMCAYLKRSGFTQIPVLSCSTPNPSAVSFVRASPTEFPLSTTTAALSTQASKTKEFIMPTMTASSQTSSLKTLMSSLLK
jgi:hypothetical protein